ncbi:PREDICTED: uncharacterized protein LOC109588420 [Amphimedon queenslandica]|uniref:Uncharacterized protein n=1 Tax=Amphimedon queenslandica TaxID=400682 RepID=A0AAN0JTC3_AMPQE|nr:PREDICTED: uncharacterized protein LOC109588420 [Amphimedon queenslandica]|eukprot:XP_019860152.1 PREDICTED: uncharacterized protein LOC109588420 [Amphimedon queenslandica]
MGLWQNCSNTKCQGLSNPSGAVIGVRAMLCMSLMSGLIGWAVGMVALIAHKPRFLFTVALAFGIQAFLWFIAWSIGVHKRIEVQQRSQSRMVILLYRMAWVLPCCLQCHLLRFCWCVSTQETSK